MVECGGLENRCRFAPTQGSNPCLSAISHLNRSIKWDLVSLTPSEPHSAHWLPQADKGRGGWCVHVFVIVSPTVCISGAGWFWVRCARIGRNFDCRVRQGIFRPARHSLTCAGLGRGPGWTWARTGLDVGSGRVGVRVQRGPGPHTRPPGPPTPPRALPRTGR